MTDIDNKLVLYFGRDTFPENVEAVWGARLIWPNDLVHDRQDLVGHSPEAKDALIAWLNGPGGGDGAIGKMRAKLGDANSRFEIGLTSNAQEEEVIIYEDEIGKIVGSPQGSHGYVYVCGWLKEHVG